MRAGARAEGGAEGVRHGPSRGHRHPRARLDRGPEVGIQKPMPLTRLWASIWLLPWSMCVSCQDPAANYDH